MPKPINVPLGTRYGRLETLGDPFSLPSLVGSRRKRIRHVVCRCSCGQTGVYPLGSLRSGNTTSCGCYGRERYAEAHYKHGHGGTRSSPPRGLYRRWLGMKARCRREASYLQKGITVCEEWSGDFTAFYAFAMRNGWQEHLSVERKDVYKGYSPENVTFIPHNEQARNTSVNVSLTAFGETKAVWAWLLDSRCLVCRRTLRTRVVALGWDAETAIATPPRKVRRKSTAKDKPCGTGIPA